MKRRDFLKITGKTIALSAAGKILKGGIAKAITPEMVMFNNSYITPSTKHDSYAGLEYFNHSNNLRRKQGSPFLAKGEPLDIQGFVTDLMDIPIENARIKIWQANNMGYYNYLADEENPWQYDQDFSSTGVCVTNNIGYYSFHTIVPGTYGRRAPHIHLLCEHDVYEGIETQIFLEKHPDNDKDPIYKNMSSSSKVLLTGSVNSASDKSSYGKKMNFNIKLNTLHNSKTI